MEKNLIILFLMLIISPLKSQTFEDIYWMEEYEYANRINRFYNDGFNYPIQYNTFYYNTYVTTYFYRPSNWFWYGYYMTYSYNMSYYYHKPYNSYHYFYFNYGYNPYFILINNNYNIANNNYNNNNNNRPRFNTNSGSIPRTQNLNSSRLDRYNESSTNITQPTPRQQIYNRQNNNTTAPRQQIHNKPNDITRPIPRQQINKANNNITTPRPIIKK
jgi:hypothetical protein